MGSALSIHVKRVISNLTSFLSYVLIYSFYLYIYCLVPEVNLLVLNTLVLDLIPCTGMISIRFVRDDLWAEIVLYLRSEGLNCLNTTKIYLGRGSWTRHGIHSMELWLTIMVISTQ